MDHVIVLRMDDRYGRCAGCLDTPALVETPHCQMAALLPAISLSLFLALGHRCTRNRNRRPVEVGACSVRIMGALENSCIVHWWSKVEKQVAKYP